MTTMENLNTILTTMRSVCYAGLQGDIEMRFAILAMESLEQRKNGVSVSVLSRTFLIFFISQSSLYHTNRNGGNIMVDPLLPYQT